METRQSVHTLHVQLTQDNHWTLIQVLEQKNLKTLFTFSTFSVLILEEFLLIVQ